MYWCCDSLLLWYCYKEMGGHGFGMTSVQKWAKLLRKWICIFMQHCFMKMINISILHIKPSHVTNIYHLSFNLVFRFKFVFMIVKTWHACLIWGSIQCLKIHSWLIICRLHLSSFEDIGWVLAGEIYLKSFKGNYVIIPLSDR